MFCISCGFSEICCIRLCIPGLLNIPATHAKPQLGLSHVGQSAGGGVHVVAPPLTVAQAACVYAQGVGHAGVGACRVGGGGGAGGRRAPAAPSGSSALRGVGGVRWPPRVGQRLAVLRPRRLGAGLGVSAESRERVVAKLQGGKRKTIEDFKTLGDRGATMEVYLLPAPLQH